MCGLAPISNLAPCFGAAALQWMSGKITRPAPSWPQCPAGKEEADEHQNLRIRTSQSAAAALRWFGLICTLLAVLTLMLWRDSLLPILRSAGHHHPYLQHLQLPPTAAQPMLACCRNLLAAHAAACRCYYLVLLVVMLLLLDSQCIHLTAALIWAQSSCKRTSATGAPVSRYAVHCSLVLNCLLLVAFHCCFCHLLLPDGCQCHCHRQLPSSATAYSRLGPSPQHPGPVPTCLAEAIAEAAVHQLQVPHAASARRLAADGLHAPVVCAGKGRVEHTVSHHIVSIVILFLATPVSSCPLGASRLLLHTTSISCYCCSSRQCQGRPPPAGAATPSQLRSTSAYSTARPPARAVLPIPWAQTG